MLLGMRAKYIEIVKSANGDLYNGDSGYRPESDKDMHKWLLECAEASDFEAAELTDFFDLMKSYLNTIDWTCDTITWAMTEVIHSLHKDVFTESNQIFLNTLIDCADTIGEIVPLWQICRVFIKFFVNCLFFWATFHCW